MQASTENAGKRQGSNASKIRNAGPRMYTFLTINEGDPSQRRTKRKLLLWRIGCIPDDHKCTWDVRNTPKPPGSHLIGCSGIGAVVSGLYRGLTEHHRPEQGSHTWLDIVLNDRALIKKPEVCEAIRGKWAGCGRCALGGTQSPERAVGLWDMKRVVAQDKKEEGGEEGAKTSN